jgi:hypothetical protein
VRTLERRKEVTTVVAAFKKVTNGMMSSFKSVFRMGKEEQETA